MRKLFFLDTTLRDGEQTPGVMFGTDEKVELALELERAGVDIVEAGFAGSGAADMLAIRAVAQALRTARVCSLSRCVEADIRASAAAISAAKKPRLHLVIACSDLHMREKLRMTREEVLRRAVEMTRLAKSLAADVEFSAEDAARADKEFLFSVFSAVIQAGATVISAPDTVGYCTPDEYFSLISDIRKHVRGAGDVVISAHCHDDLGQATANTLAAIRAGATQVECTINGLGERAGNAAFEEIVMNIASRKSYYNVEHGINTKNIYRLSRLAAGLSGIEPPPNKPVVGANAFVHQSGIHQHGVMQNRDTYEIIHAEDIGVPSGEMALGKLSGRHAFAQRVQELGYRLSVDAFETSFIKFKDLAEKKRDLTDRDIEAIISSSARTALHVYKLVSYQTFSGNKTAATATVTLERDNITYLEAAVGDGPIDAAYQAINKIIGVEFKLLGYTIKAVTEGTDALGEVSVRVSHGDTKTTGKGVSTDIIESSVLAYLSAVNRLTTISEQ